MSRPMKIGVIVALAAAVGVVLAMKIGREGDTGDPSTGANQPLPPVDAAASGPSATGPLPRLLDLGATKCIPCKMMAPILKELRETFAGQFDVTFTDVWENREAGRQHGIRAIPTQIFFDAEGRELFRHEGFYGREQILAKWKQLGFEFDEAGGEAVNE